MQRENPGVQKILVLNNCGATTSATRNGLQWRLWNTEEFGALCRHVYMVGTHNSDVPQQWNRHGK